MYSHQEILDFENEMKELEADLGKVQHRYVDEQKEEIVTPIILYSPSPTHFTLRNKITSFIQAQFFTDAYQLGVPLVTMCVNFRNAPHHTQAEKEARITQAKVTLRLIAFLHCIPDANQQVVNGVKVLKGTPEYSDKINIAGQPFKDIRDQLPKLDPTAANGINWGDPTPKMFARGVRSAIIEPVTDDAFNRFVPDLKDPNKDPNKEGYSNAKCDHFFHALKLDEEIQSALAIITIYHSKLTSLLTKHHADKDKSSAKALSEKIKILDTASEKLITLLKALNEDFKKNKNNVTKMRKQLYETLRACHKLLGEKPTQMSLETA